MMQFEVCGFEHIHRHSHYSTLDGFAKIEEYAAYSKEVNQQYLVITDHGVLSGIPSQLRACAKYQLKPIFGIEAYVNDKQPTVQTDAQYKKYWDALSDEDRKVLNKSYHLIIVAYTDVGYSNLVKLSTWSYQYGYGGLPRRARMTYEQLLRHKEGLLFSSCCYLGEIGQTFDTKGPDAAEDVLRRYMAMFGDHFYLEIMLLDFAQQKPYDAWLVAMHEKYHVPIICTQDCHYCKKDDAKYQKYMLLTRGKRTVHDLEEAMKSNEAEQYFELQDQNLWMKSEDELNAKWLADYHSFVPYEVFCQSKKNTVEFCRRAEGVTIDRSIKLPQLPDADERLWEALRVGMKWRGLAGKPEYEKRLKQEYALICRKDFSSYFLITQMFINEARNICPKILGWGTGDEAIAPGRGSAVSFLSCYVLGITGVDPIKHELLPERFLSDARGGRQLKLEFVSEPIVA